MRVIGGEFRSRKLKTPLGDSIRPTPDRLREALFNILAPRIEGLVFLDAYAGSGSVGIEALSRGARRVIFIEKSRAALRALQDNITTLGIRERCDLHPDSAATIITRFDADIVFLDPPYELEPEYAAVLDTLGDAPPQLVVVQHSVRFDTGDAHGALRRTRVLKQGDNALSFYAIP